VKKYELFTIHLQIAMPNGQPPIAEEKTYLIMAINARDGLITLIKFRIHQKGRGYQPTVQTTAAFRLQDGTLYRVLLAKNLTRFCKPVGFINVD
jgi:hypothetical protein